jgi:anion-transporting  ArsA/GET3 family ATPase
VRIINDLLSRRVIVLLGKGGVGRTSVAAAIAHLAAARRMRTLLMETDPRTPIAAAHDRKSAYRPIELAPRLWSMLLDRQASLEEYLGFVVARPLLSAVFASPLYQYFVHAAPALRQLLMMGKIYHEIERRPPNLPRWDLVIVDLPSSGQALSMLGMPFAARETFGNNLVGREALEVARFFRDPAKCAMVVVTTLDQLALTETLEIHRRLTALEIATAAVVFNRMAGSAFEESDVSSMLRRAGRSAASGQFEDLAAIARTELQRRKRDRRAIGILQRAIGAPILPLVEYRDASGIALATRIAAQLDASAAASAARDRG